MARDITEDGRFEDRLRAALPHYGSPELQPVQFADLFADLAAVAAARARFLGELLDQQYRAEGMEGLVGHRYGIDMRAGGTEELSEELRALVVLEAAERDRAERLARDGLKLGIEAKKIDVLRGYARTVAETLRTFALELGANWSDPLVRRAAQRAVIAARQNLGVDFSSPDRVGPRLTEVEQRRVLGDGE